MEPLALMSAAYRMSDYALEYHVRKIQELERRRREMKRAMMCCKNPPA